MFRSLLRATGALILVSLWLSPLAALAHEEIEAGDYVIEYGWETEPPLAGQTNAIILNISGKASVDEHAEAGKISLVAPAEGAVINGDQVDVTIAVEGIDEHLAETMHWHLKVDEQTLTMAPVSQSTVTVVGLGNGSHTIEAALSLVNHGEVGTPTKVVVTVSGSTATGAPTVAGVDPIAGDQGEAIDVDVSGLKVELVYGGQTTPLTLQPVADQPGHFTAAFTPERPGVHTLRLAGKLNGSFGAAEVNAEVEPEEVTPGPTPAGGGGQGGSSNAILWIIIGGAVIVSVAGGVFVMTRKK